MNEALLHELGIANALAHVLHTFHSERAIRGPRL